MKQLLLVRHGTTAATRTRAFPADEPLDDFARSAAAELPLPIGWAAFTSPARRARDTAAAAGLSAKAEPRLAECDFGAWAGQNPRDLHRADPAATRAWMTDPCARPHGGESLHTFYARVASWLDEEAGRGDDVVAVTHGGVIRASVAHAIGAGVGAVWQIAVDPLSITELRSQDGVWSLRRLNWSRES